jgi:hypothetical protein
MWLSEAGTLICLASTADSRSTVRMSCSANLRCIASQRSGRRSRLMQTLRAKVLSIVAVDFMRAFFPGTG